MTHSREGIVAAARELFLQSGYRGTSMSDIRKASGATTGSLYHFFAGKTDIALAVLETGIAEWAEATPSTEDFAARLKGSVRGLVLWGLRHPSDARFLIELRGMARHDPDLERVAAFFAKGAKAAEADYSAAVVRSEVKPLPWPVAHALILGPVYDFLHVSEVHEDGETLATLFAEQAWEAVCLRKA